MTKQPSKTKNYLHQSTHNIVHHVHTDVRTLARSLLRHAGDDGTELIGLKVFVAGCWGEGHVRGFNKEIFGASSHTGTYVRTYYSTYVSG